MKRQAFVITAGVALFLGIVAHLTPAAFANPCSSTTINKEGKDSYSSMGMEKKKENENNNGNNCNGGNGGYGVAIVAVFRNGCFLRTGGEMVERIGR